MLQSCRNIRVTIRPWMHWCGEYGAAFQLSGFHESVWGEMAFCDKQFLSLMMKQVWERCRQSAIWG